MRELEYPFDSVGILKNKKKLKKKLLSNEDLLEKRIAILSGSTIGEIKNILEIFLLNEGIKPIFFEGNYNRFYEDALFENPELEKFKPEIVYIHTSSKNIDRFPKINSSKEENLDLQNSIIGKYESIWKVLQEKYKCIIIQNNFEMLPYRIMGNADAYRLNGRIEFIQKLNASLYDSANKIEGLYINDIHYLSASYGLDRWHDSMNWYMYKYMMPLEAIPLLCSNLVHIIKSIYGKNKKAIVIDLDNTLWGGIIGDDGLENIALGIQDAKGNAYLEFQKYIKAITELGIVLNISSKNEEEIALTGLSHPASILKKEDFVYIECNWEPKYISIEKIINKLNILPESVVFIDDNIVERELVGNTLSKVAIPAMGQVEKYIEVIDKNGYFEITHMSREDMERNKYYQDNQKRQLEIKKFTEYSNYLESLEMKLFVDKVKECNLKRVVQVINKTNQFNFTTKRYSEAELMKIINDTNYLTVVGRLIDKFGDNGIISVIIGKIEQNTCIIDLWLMSCRVFKREVEVAMLNAFVNRCKVLNVSRIIGKYISTSKNAMIKEYYENIGFKLIFTNGNEKQYEIDVSDLEVYKTTVMEVINYE